MYLPTELDTDDIIYIYSSLYTLYIASLSDILEKRNDSSMNETSIFNYSTCAFLVCMNELQKSGMNERITSCKISKN